MKINLVEISKKTVKKKSDHSEGETECFPDHETNLDNDDKSEI